MKRAMEEPERSIDVSERATAADARTNTELAAGEEQEGHC